jgi:glyoxylase-like metal-dependent hydrolase (beta-lactamase superfamily II)
VRKDLEAASNWASPGAFEVVPDLYRIPLPLPKDGLRAVNVYALLDDAGVGLIDSGWAIPDARSQLQESLALLDRHPRDVHRILVTHIHRDHYTQAVALRREFGSLVSLGAGERPALEVIMQPGRAAEIQLEHLQRQGAGALVASVSELLGIESRSRPENWAAPDEWLQPGQLNLAGHRLEAVSTPGHTTGHLVFRDVARSLLFAGDHVLPTITPSIGFETPPAPNPLRDFMSSLTKMRSLPDARLLPAHGPVTDSVHDRIDELVVHHETRLASTEKAVRSGATNAYEVAKLLLWTRRNRSFADLDPFNQMLAVNETAAHLEMLATLGRCTASTQDCIRVFG